MDSFTQIVLGAGVAEVTSGRKIGNRALLWGAVCGTIPDLDVYIPTSNIIEFYQVHRGFSHSIAFAVLITLPLGWILNSFYKKLNHGISTWMTLVFFSTVTHPILDCFTTFGTELFSPFSDYRVALNSVFVVDPFYTLPFFICVFSLLFLKKSNPNRRTLAKTGIILSTLYLFWSLSIKLYINNVFEDELNNQNKKYFDYITLPSPLNTFLWRVVAQGEKGFWVGHYSIFSPKKIDFIYVDHNRDILPEDLLENNQFKRLDKITKGQYIVSKKGENFVFTDMRFQVFLGWEQVSYKSDRFSIELIKKNDDYHFQRLKENQNYFNLESVVEILDVLYKKIFY
ncbi:metal-dependent hydrolase [Ichthyobacterium seriolicida]|uniref:Membrane-bound metal-dependent hydrolase n=1 Tax=Ichthyobacterium seriolicida TaxID=242600 RepID=A0A1J1E7Y1_9FLAO|nr:metal-dependent hydrolase [Ichthyobacterium seriolicida]BAV94035.1 membrane-bound metal-dependent hydrolase [Ichthyobacterium seriolicida]